jgi:hypothetical protein
MNRISSYVQFYHYLYTLQIYFLLGKVNNSVVRSSTLTQSNVRSMEIVFNGTIKSVDKHFEEIEYTGNSLKVFTIWPFTRNILINNLFTNILSFCHIGGGYIKLEKIYNRKLLKSHNSIDRCI